MPTQADLRVDLRTSEAYLGAEQRWRAHPTAGHVAPAGPTAWRLLAELGPTEPVVWIGWARPEERFGSWLVALTPTRLVGVDPVASATSPHADSWHLPNEHAQAGPAGTADAPVEADLTLRPRRGAPLRLLGALVLDDGRVRQVLGVPHLPAFVPDPPAPPPAAPRRPFAPSLVAATQPSGAGRAATVRRDRDDQRAALARERASQEAIARSRERAKAQAHEEVRLAARRELATEEAAAAAGRAAQARADAEAQARARAGQPVVITWQSAERLGAWHMHGLGFHDAVLTPRGADAGLDVTAENAVAQVKFQSAPVGRPALQRLRGAAMSVPWVLFYSSAGYARTAVPFADTAGICLFTFDRYAVVTPDNKAAQVLLDERRLPTALDPAEFMIEPRTDAALREMLAEAHQALLSARRDVKRHITKFGGTPAVRGQADKLAAGAMEYVDALRARRHSYEDTLDFIQEVYDTAADIRQLIADPGQSG